MKKIKLIAAICLMAFADTMLALNITPNQLKQARMAVYDWVDSYLAYSYLDNDYDVDNYKMLFANDQVLVTNDYLPITDNEQIFISEYVENFLDTTAFYKSKPLTREESIRVISETEEDGKYKCVLTVDKEISFYGRDKTYQYPPKGYTLRIELQVDLDSFIVSCENISSSDDLHVEAILHDASNGSNTYIRLEDTISLLKEIMDEPIIIVPKITSPTFDRKMIEVSRDTLKRNVHFGVFIGTSFFSHQLINNIFTSIKDRASFAWNVNIGLYRQFFLKNSHRLGLEYGLHLNQNKYSFNGKLIDSYEAIDDDDFDYIRMINSEDYNETLQLLSLSIPLSIRYDNFITPNITVFASVGAYVSATFAQSSKLSAIAQYSGNYPTLFDITISENGFYDFGSHTLQWYTNQLALGRFNVGILSSFGCQYFIPKTSWSIEPSVYFQTSLYNPISSASDIHIIDDKGKWHSATYLFSNMFLYNFGFQMSINYNFK